MWVISQEETTFIKVWCFEIRTYKDRNPGVYIVANDSVIIGKYENMDDAISVLNMIHTIINAGEENDRIYQIPKDPAVKRKLKNHKPVVDLNQWEGVK